MALFNNGFKPNYRHTIYNSREISLRAFKYDVEFWALTNKIRMKLRMGDPDGIGGYIFSHMIAYFEDEQDLVAFKLKFNV